MASMNRQERAQSYYNRLLKSTNLQDEIKKIIDEINTLQWTETKKPLTKGEKLLIVDELKALIESKPAFESMSESSEERGFEINASDNSGTLDIIDTITKGID